MRAAIKLGMLAAVTVISACGKREPDFTLLVKSPDGSRGAAVLRGFQPRGTISGSLVLSFEKDGDGNTVGTITRLVNAKVGWISVDTMAIVADRLTYRNLGNDYYYPEGALESKVRLVVCARRDMDCTSLESRLEESASVQSISQFPEGDWPKIFPWM